MSDRLGARMLMDPKIWIWGRYKEAREPRSEEMKRELVQALMLAQEAQAESATINQMSVEVGRLSPIR